MSILRPAEVSTLRMGEKVMRVRIIVQIVRVCGSGRMGLFCDQLVVFSACTGSASHAWRSNAIAVGHAVGRLLRRNGSAWRKRARQGWQFLKTVSGIQQIQVGFIRPPHCLLAAFAFGRAISATFVSQVTDSAGQQAQATLKRMANCRQKVALILMGDETFPHILDWQSLRAKATAWGWLSVRMFDPGVKVVRQQSRDLGALFKDVIGKEYQPQYFLSDFDVHFPRSSVRRSRYPFLARFRNGK